MKWKINTIISSVTTNNQIMHMKYKILLLLVFSIILAKSTYGQQPDTLHWSGTGAMVDTDGHYFNGPFGDGSLSQQLISLHADVYWHNGVAQYGDGIRIGSLSVGTEGVGAYNKYEFTIQNNEPGSATLTLERSISRGVLLTIEKLTPIFIGHIYEKKPEKLFNRNDQEIDPRTGQPTNQSNSSGGSGSGGGGTSGGGGGAASGGNNPLGVLEYPSGSSTLESYAVFDSSGNLVGQATRDSDGAWVITPYKQGVTPKQIKDAIKKYRAE